MHYNDKDTCGIQEYFRRAMVMVMDWITKMVHLVIITAIITQVSQATVYSSITVCTKIKAFLEQCQLRNMTFSRYVYVGRVSLYHYSIAVASKSLTQPMTFYVT